jgi:lipopolysaccharide transport system ATP-binding protein
MGARGPAIAVRAEGLGKRYRTGQRVPYRALRDVLSAAVAAPFRRLASPAGPAGATAGGREDGLFWALRDVSFEVGRGEVLGIIGRNGAGKSTLLKILARITTPTAGHAAVAGRAGSLLEVGAGFHPELTGRENIYLNGAILGMKRAEIGRKFDEIVAFAEVERFVDTPVKRYSSGMYMRLAFAVAAHLEPEILFVDEVLAVGDAAFQKKCLGRMGQVAETGRTILFVSHNLLAMQDLCHRVLWLHDGRIVDQGSPGRVVSRYLQTSFSALSERRWADPATAPGNGEIRLRRAAVRPAGGTPADPIATDTPFVLEFEYWNLRDGARISPVITLHNEQGIVVFEAGPTGESGWQGRAFPVGLFRDVCQVPGNLLNNGVHRVEFRLADGQWTLLHKEADILVFDIQDSVEQRGGWYGDWAGAIRPILDWRTSRLADASPAVSSRGVG